MTDVEQAIIANRPREPFVYSGDGMSLDGLDWQAPTEPPTWDEVNAWVTELRAARARDTKRAELEAALARSDLWAIRHAEDGVSLTGARRNYRAALRGLLDKLSAGADPDALVLPDPPPYP